MVRFLAMILGLVALTARGEGLVVTEDLPAGAKVSSAHVRTVKVPASLKSSVVGPDSLLYLKDTVLRFPLRKGDLVLWSAFFLTPEHVEACTAALRVPK